MAVRRFRVHIERHADEGVWVTFVPALNHLSTYGATREEALERTREAILGYFEAAQKEGIPVPDDAGDVELIEVEVSAV